MNKIRFFCILLISVMLLSTLSSCVVKPQLDSGNPSVLYAWIGEYSEKNWEKAIKTYVKKCTPVLYEECADTGMFTFEVDFEAKYASVPMHARVPTDKVEDEMHSFVDSIPRTEVSGNKVSVDVSQRLWGYTGVWSCLVWVSDAEHVVHYYYFRIDYTKTE